MSHVEVKENGVYCILAITDFNQFILKAGDVVIQDPAGMMILRKTSDIPSEYFERQEQLAQMQMAMTQMQSVNPMGISNRGIG